MSDSRLWMYQRLDKNGYVRNEFIDGVQAFVDFALSQPGLLSHGKIKCPCSKCKNLQYQKVECVCGHLCQSGFTNGYLTWNHHGEECHSRVSGATSDVPQMDNTNSYKDMVIDAMGPTIFEELKEVRGESESMDPKASRFYNLLRDADEPLWDGCKKHTKLTAASQFLQIKSEFNLSQRCYDRIVSTVKDMMPDDAKLATNVYLVKKQLRELGLDYKKIHACVNNCMLYYKEHAHKKLCDICKHPRFKPRNGKRRNNVPFKVLRYLPLTPRLQRLFMSEKTAEHMKWHFYNRSQSGFMTHPTDGEAWHHFDRTYPSFSADPRNVRIGLSTDGFDPFGTFGAQYSCWPVVICVYNLPPAMCMKSPYMFLSLVIPGPKSPGKNIDVFLRPLIDELKQLWDVGVSTYDAHMKENFQMRVALMWTISDFPAYAMLSGWSTHGKLACPYCMERTKAFWLKNGGKHSWFDCTRQFLSVDHPYRKQRDKFKNKHVEYDLPPPRLSGVELFACLPCSNIIFGTKGGDKKLPGFGVEHNWVKRSIFWELEYWKTNLIRHNLDVMHIEKNIFENLFFTVMDIDGKTKDNIKAREDMKIICNRKELELSWSKNKRIKPKASYVLNKDQQRDVRLWLKDLKLPDGYASNISRCVSIDDNKAFGFKSHDCHVLLERLLPVAFHGLLPLPVWDAITELCNFFKDICAVVQRVCHLEILENNIVETICRLEKIFPPSFFDSMEHLPLHLVYEAKVGGPVQYRWMYPFESYMRELKSMVKNKAAVEASICEAYLIQEISTFSSFYFEPNICTRINRVPRNDDGGANETSGRLSIFCHPGRSYGACKRGTMSDDETTMAHIYILLNTPEIDCYVRMYDEMLGQRYPNITDEDIERSRTNNFAQWLKQYVSENEVDRRIRGLAQGPYRKTKQYKGYFSNGFLFDIHQGQGKSTNNSGVCIKGSCYNYHERDYFGILEDVWELSYSGVKNNVVVFKCHWFDTEKGMNVHKKHGLVEIKYNSKLSTNEPFVLSEQAQQVYFLPYVSKDKTKKLFRVVCKTRARNRVDMSFLDSQDEDNSDPSVDGYYQEDVMSESIELGSTDMLDVPNILVDGQDYHRAVEEENDEEEVEEENGEEEEAEDDEEDDGDEENDVNESEEEHDEDYSDSSYEGDGED